MSTALADRPADSLDAALAAVEEALPPGWVFDGLQSVWVGPTLLSWAATAQDPAHPNTDIASIHYGSCPTETGVASTMVAAVRALEGKFRTTKAGR